MTVEADIAQSIWSANERLLTFGTPAAPSTAEEEIAAAVWAYADRSLTVSRPTRVPRIRATQRPDKFTLNRNSPLFRGLVFAGLGGMQTKTTHYHDSSGRGNHGTLTNMDPATDWSRDIGRAVVDFDKSDDCITFATRTFVSPITFSLWAKATVNVTDNQMIMGYGPVDLGPAGPTYLQLYNSTWRWVLNNATVTDAPATLNTWTHLVGTYDRNASTRMQFFVNGNLADSDAASSVALNTGEFVIGRRPSNTTLAFGGQVADPLVYTRVLSSGEISALADPSNVMLEVGGVPLIESTRTYFPVAVASQTKKLYWPRKSNRRNPILSMEEILYVASNLGRDSDAPHLWRGLVGAWPLQEPGGVTAFDASGRKRNLTLTSMDVSTAHAVGTMGRAVNLDGSDDVLVGPANSGMYGAEGLTVSAWVNFRTIGVAAAEYLASYATDATTYAWIFFAYDNPADNIAFQAGTTLYKIAANGAAKTGWHHYCATYSGGAVATGIRIYVDGGEAPYASSKDGARNADSAAHAIRFGNRADAMRPLDGLLGPLNVYSRVLSLAEIQHLYADPWAMYRLRKKTAYFFLHTGPRVVDAAFSNDSPFDVSESIGTVTATDAIGAKTWEIVSQTQE